MFGLTSFDTVSAALKASAYNLQAQDDAALARASFDLLRLYEGNQLPQVWAYLATHMKNQELLKRYQSLATFQNIVRLLVDRVATMGELPVRVVWHNGEGEPHAAAQKKWDEVASRRMGESSWAAAIPAIARETELVKTVVAAVTWDAEEGRIALDRYTPNQILVGYSKGAHRQRTPDRWFILKGEAQNAWQAWDFSSGGGMVFDVTSDGDGAFQASADEAIPYPVRDPKTNRQAVPFVAFRTSLPRDGYFTWDGQLELLEAQGFLNKTLTQLAYQLHYGAFRMPILSGPGWVDDNGTTRPLILDQGMALVEPSDPFGAVNDHGAPKIRWDGPADEEVIRVLLETINYSTEAAAATFGVNASAIRAKNEATSGYALQIESAALRSKHSRTRTLAQAPLERLVELIRWTWDTYSGEEAFPADSMFDVVIPDYGTGVTTREEWDADLGKLKAGIVSKRTLILKYNPGISSEECTALMDEADEAEAMAEAPVLVQLVNAEILTKDEAREELDYPPLPEEPVPPPPSGFRFLPGGFPPPRNLAADPEEPPDPNESETPPPVTGGTDAKAAVPSEE